MFFALVFPLPKTAHIVSHINSSAMAISREQHRLTLHNVDHFVATTEHNGLVHTHLFERPEWCHHTEMHPQSWTGGSGGEQKIIRNEMRQAALIENLYKCLFVGDVVEIYKKYRRFVCLSFPTPAGTWCIRNIYCIPNLFYYLWPSPRLDIGCCDAKTFFWVINFGMRKIEKETNATDEKSNGFHQSFY